MQTGTIKCAKHDCDIILKKGKLHCEICDKYCANLKLAYSPEDAEFLARRWYAEKGGRS